MEFIREEELVNRGWLLELTRYLCIIRDDLEGVEDCALRASCADRHIRPVEWACGCAGWRNDAEENKRYACPEECPKHCASLRRFSPSLLDHLSSWAEIYT